MRNPGLPSLILFVSFLFRHLFYQGLGGNLMNAGYELQNTTDHPFLAPGAYVFSAVALLLPFWISRFYWKKAVDRVSALAWASLVVIGFYIGFIACYFLLPDQVLFPWRASYEGYFSANRSHLVDTFFQLVASFLILFAIASVFHHWRFRKRSKNAQATFSLRDSALAMTAIALACSTHALSPLFSGIDSMEFAQELVAFLVISTIAFAYVGCLRMIGNRSYVHIVCISCVSSLPIIAVSYTHLTLPTKA